MLHTTSKFFYRPALGLFLVRLVAGLIFVHHGWSKLQNLSGVENFFSTLGITPTLAVVVALVEFIGGLMLIFGIASRAAGVALGIVALVAALLVHVPNGGIVGAEFELLLAAVSFGIALHGAGRLRLIHLFEHDRDTHDKEHTE